MPTNVTKATLTIEGQAPLSCLFNPKDFSVTKAKTWTSKASPGKTAVQPTFGGGQPRGTGGTGSRVADDDLVLVLDCVDLPVG